jgi:hypothetical protein
MTDDPPLPRRLAAPPVPSPRRRPGGPRWLAALGLLGALGLTACGADPDYQYVANSDRSIVVRLPADWTQVAAKDVAESATTSKQWLGLWDASSSPTIGHFDQDTPAASLTAPVVEIVTFPTTPEQARAFTTDKLLDIIWPASTKGVQRRKIQAQIAVDPDIQFAPLAAGEVSRANGRGVVSVSAYDFGNGTLGIAKLVLLDTDSRHLHAIQVWCSLGCMNARSDEINGVLESFTVKKT